MDSVPVFLNDASYPLVTEDEQVMHEEIVQLLQTLLSIKALSRPVVLGSAARLWDVPLTNGYRTLATFAEVIDREWWRFIRSLDQQVPFSSVPQCLPPGDDQHVLDPWSDAAAPLWAQKNDSFLLSFPSREEWRGHLARFEVCACGGGPHNSEEIDCRNLSSPSHVEHWRSELLDFHLMEAASSTVYECDSFRLKMYLLDHEPPHVHVYQSDNFRKCVGRVRFDHVEIMEDEGFSGAVKRLVIPFLSERQDELLRAWERCRSGQLPNALSD